MGMHGSGSAAHRDSVFTFVGTLQLGLLTNCCCLHAVLLGLIMSLAALPEPCFASCRHAVCFDQA